MAQISQIFPGSYLRQSPKSADNPFVRRVLIGFEAWGFFGVLNRAPLLTSGF
jgi:hypothetical protein